MIAVLLLTAGVLSAQQYFPSGVLGETQESHKFSVDWYSKHLTALQEPSLWELSKQDAKAHVYRFLWLRSFDHPVAIRLAVKPDGTGLLTTKMTSGQGGHEPGRLIRIRIARSSQQQTQWFLDRIEEANFWKLPSREELGVALDGAQWIFEALKDGKYHIVDRWSPDVRTPARILGEIMLFDLAHMKLLYQDVY
jgi:hypothetical protein